ncbi:hypothetical protein MKW92_031536, partial [Papaver armeniacum]
RLQGNTEGLMQMALVSYSVVMHTHEKERLEIRQAFEGVHHVPGIVEAKLRKTAYVKIIEVSG